MEKEKNIPYSNFKALIDLNEQLCRQNDKLLKENQKLTEMVQNLNKFNILGELFYDIRTICNKRCG